MITARQMVMASLAMIVAAGCAHRREEHQVDRRALDERLSRIGAKVENAQEAGDFDRASAGIDEMIAACLEQKTPAARQGAGWFAGAEFTVLLNEKQYARAAARGEKNFDLIVEWPESKAGMGEQALEMGDQSPALLALARRFADHAEKVAKSSRPINEGELERVRQLGERITAAAAKPVSRPA